jgi:CHASE2 domain-containing sensor protein
MKTYKLTELKYRFKKLWRKWAAILVQGLIAMLVAIGASFFWTRDAGQAADLFVLRNFFEWRGSRTAPEEVILVAIDDFSYGKLQASTRQPFPRKHTAEALERIVEAKPRVLILDAGIPKEDLDPAADARLEAALKAGPTTIFSGQIPSEDSGVSTSNPTPELIIPSDEKFRKAAKLELPMTVPVTHGVVSRMLTNSKAGNNLAQTIPIARALIDLGAYSLESPGKFDLINYYGPAGHIKRIPIYEFIGEFYKPESAQMLKGKVVLLGFQSLLRERGQIDKDELMISASEKAMFGVEIHATMIGNLLDRSWLKRLDLFYEHYSLFVASFVLALLGVFLTPEKSVPAIAIISGIVVGIAYLLFSGYNFWMAGVGTLLFTAIFTMLGSAIYHYIIIKSFKTYLKKTFNFQLEREL